MILAAVISFLCIVAIIVYACIQNKSSANYAKIYVKNTLIEEINLRAASEEENEITVHGENGDMKISYHKGEIKAKESNCPHQYCVNKGYVSRANDPIVCVYNAVYIVIEGASEHDAIIQ